jgi:hypothetical protein
MAHNLQFLSLAALLMGSVPALAWTQSVQGTGTAPRYHDDGLKRAEEGAALSCTAKISELVGQCSREGNIAQVTACTQSRQDIDGTHDLWKLTFTGEVTCAPRS